MKRFLLFIFGVLFTTHSFAQVTVSFTWDTIFLKDTYCRRVSLSPSNHCWSIVNKDSSALYEINNTDHIFNRTAGVQSVTAAKYSDLVALDSNVVLIGTPTDYLVKYKAGIYSKLGATAGFKTNNINSLERMGKNSSFITPYNKYGVALGTAKGLYTSYDNSTFNTDFLSAANLNGGNLNDSITIVHYINVGAISVNVKSRSYLCPNDEKIAYIDVALTNNVTLLIPHSSINQFIEQDSINTFVDIPVGGYHSLQVGGKHIWGTKNGLKYRMLSCGTIPTTYLEGTSVNKLYEMRFFPYEKYFDNPYEISNLLIGTDSGLYYDPMIWAGMHYSAVPDSLYLVDATKGYKINDIEVDSCNSRVWLATDKGIIRLHMHSTGSLSKGSILQHPNNNLPICAPTTITANNSSLYSYQWQRDSINIPGANTFEYNVTTKGNYQVIYSYSDGCRTYKDTSAAVKIELDTIICTSPIFPDTIHLCDGGSYMINSNCSIFSNSYQWYRNSILIPNEIQNRYTATTDGYYKLKISNCNVSKFSDSIFIDKPFIPKPILNITPGNILCEGDSAKLSVSSGDYSISWNKRDLPVQTNSSTDYYVTSTNTYSASYSKNNCTVTSDPIKVVFNTISKVSIIANKQLPLCEGDQIMLTAQNNSNNYKWSSGENTKTVYKSTADRYKVVSYDYNNCKSADSISIVLAPKPNFNIGKDTTFCEGYNKPINITMSGNFAHYSVNSIPIKTTILEVHTAGQYIITATDFNSCSNSDTIVVFNSCPEIFIPNLITPNSDHKNDFLCIKGLLPGCTLEIYNCWGDLVYLNTNYNNDWNGEALSDGVYYYTFKSIYYNKHWKGWVEIKR